MLRDIELRPGDMFCARGTGIFSAGIRAAERWWSRDNEATYGHTGIILDSEGTVLDTLWKVERTSLARYAGQQILIARPTHTIYGTPISTATMANALESIVRTDMGRWYPIHRLLLHLIHPPLAKHIATGRHLVCSERGAKLLSMVAARELPYTGATPDILADEWRRWRNFMVLFEGALPTNMIS